MARTEKVERNTNETRVLVELTIEGTGEAKIDCGIGFFRHMLENFARHGLFDIKMEAQGDLEVDQHHLVEDSGTVLGAAFAGALGTKEGIRRVGSCVYPMDETLARAAVDLSGRSHLFYKADLAAECIVSAAWEGACAPFLGDSLCDFWEGFTRAAGCALHLEVLRGRSDHHKLEAMFKAAGRAFREACEIDARVGERVPSTKGVLDGTGVFLC